MIFNIVFGIWCFILLIFGVSYADGDFKTDESKKFAQKFLFFAGSILAVMAIISKFFANC